MDEPIRWFEEAVNSGKYQKDVIDEIKSCVSEDGFNVGKFMEWVSQQLVKDMDEG